MQGEQEELAVVLDALGDSGDTPATPVYDMFASLTPTQSEVLHKALALVEMPRYDNACCKRVATLLPHLRLGSRTDAVDPELWCDLNLTAVVNCAFSQKLPRGSSHPLADFYGLPAGDFLPIAALDEEGYPVLERHFDAVQALLDRHVNGCVLVHCMAGINRSAALCVAYVMVHKNIGVLEAIAHCHALRPIILQNTDFVRQLVLFSDSRGLCH